MKLTQSIIWNPEMLEMKERYEFTRIIYESVERHGVNVFLYELEHAGLIRNLLKTAQNGLKDELVVLKQLLEYEFGELSKEITKRFEEISFLCDLE